MTYTKLYIQRNLGTQPFHPETKRVLASLVTKREPQEEIIVHHFTDTRQLLQLEVERRSASLGIAFERIKL